MVSFAKDNQTKTEKAGIKDVACPFCFEQVIYPTLISGGKDRYDRATRIYLGWCDDCDRGFEVVQFEKDGRWLIHKYQPYTLTKKNIHCRPTGEWITVNEMPETAPIVLGPGGDYDKHIDIKTEYFPILKALQKAIASTGEILKELLKIEGSKDS